MVKTKGLPLRHLPQYLIADHAKPIRRRSPNLPTLVQKKVTKLANLFQSILDIATILVYDSFPILKFTKSIHMGFQRRPSSRGRGIGILGKLEPTTITTHMALLSLILPKHHSTRHPTDRRSSRNKHHKVLQTNPLHSPSIVVVQHVDPLSCLFQEPQQWNS